MTILRILVAKDDRDTVTVMLAPLQPDDPDTEWMVFYDPEEEYGDGISWKVGDALKGMVTRFSMWCSEEPDATPFGRAYDILHDADQRLDAAGYIVVRCITATGNPKPHEIASAKHYARVRGALEEKLMETYKKTTAGAE